MAETLKEKVGDVAHKVADTAKTVGNKVAEGAERAVDFVKAKAGIGCTGVSVGVAGIKDHMEVIASCGKKVGVVDHMDGGTIKLTKNDSPDGQHHFIPTGWVDHVDNHVHLSKNSMETEGKWKNDAASCGCI